MSAMNADPFPRAHRHRLIAQVGRLLELLEPSRREGEPVALDLDDPGVLGPERNGLRASSR
jgi:hypothetical protein